LVGPKKTDVGECESVIGTFAYNLRFPGQYYDAETGLSQNWNRDYDPIVGRYVESDPAGLRAGVNTYTYVGSSPTEGIDPVGLITWRGAYAIGSAGPSKFGVGVGFVKGSFTLLSDCINRQRGVVSVEVIGSGWGWGISLLGPFALSGSTATFQDGQTDVNPSIFNGRFDMLSAGTIFWSKYSEFRLGGAVGTGRGWGISTELAGSFGASGVSNVVHQRVECCSQ
jgi:RHS repeat-associated protein